MSVPSGNDACWARLIAGQMPGFRTKQAALMFLLKKLQGGSEPLEQRKRALIDFFVKYERVLSVEISQLTA